MLEWILNLVFPRKCVFCRRIPSLKEFPEKGVWICKHCAKLYENNGFHVGETVLGSGKIAVDGIYTAFEYDERVRDAVLRFKFGGNVFYAKTFAYGLANEIMLGLKAVGVTFASEKFDVIVPVPLSEKRLDERGYNQAELIGVELSEFLSVPLCADGMTKVKDIPKQSKSRGEERLENVRNAFRANNNKVAGKRVLLLDDVLTTGSTLGECARVLYDAGAAKVFCATVAMARRK